MSILHGYLGGTELLKGYLGSTLLFDNTAAGSIALDNTTDTDEAAGGTTPLDISHTFSATANLIIVQLSFEEDKHPTAIAIDPTGDNIPLSLIGTATGNAGQSNVDVYGAYNFASQSGVKTVSLSFSSTWAAGAYRIQTFTGATKLPTTGDFDDTTHSAGAIALTGALTVDAGEESGIILGALCANGTPTITDAGGLTDGVGKHTYAGAAGGQRNVFDYNLGPLSGTEAPSFSWSGAQRCAAIFTLVI